MDVKLTLKLNKGVIENAKEYAKNQQVSLSRLFENYLIAITNNSKKNEEIEISDFVKSISIGKGTIPSDFDYKKERQDYLIKKHNSL
jgi:hypothetical protein